MADRVISDSGRKVICTASSKNGKKLSKEKSWSDSSGVRVHTALYRTGVPFLGRLPGTLVPGIQTHYSGLPGTHTHMHMPIYPYP